MSGPQFGAAWIDGHALLSKPPLGQTGRGRFRDADVCRIEPKLSAMVWVLLGCL
jgi:hypothetical protein